jgi:hypothetical protein
LALGNPYSGFAPDLSAARLYIRLSKGLTDDISARDGSVSNVQLDQTFDMALLLSCIGTLCWIVCFWWMHRISSRQDAMLQELREVTTRIEKLSQDEHDLISEVHPQVSEIKEHVQDVREVVSPKNS